MITTLFVVGGIFVCGCIVTLVELAKSPEGYQDETGFHTAGDDRVVAQGRETVFVKARRNDVGLVMAQATKS